VYRRIRAFGTQAEKVRDQVERGQQVELTAYGVKHGEDPVRKDGRWTKVQREGYYAGFIKAVPKDEPKS
jgi:hypothetical protein